MSQKAGIWIDHRRTIIVSASAGDVRTRTVESRVEPHPRYSAQQGGGSERGYEARHSEQLNQYYDDVIAQIGVPDTLLIFGPGEAKVELKERLSRSKAFAASSVVVETADELSEAQVVAKVKKHFDIEG